MPILVPPKEVFEVPPQPPQQRVVGTGYQLPMNELPRVIRSKDGEQLTVFKEFPVARKGVVYTEAVESNNEAKRLILAVFSPFFCKEMIIGFIGFFFTPYKWKIKIIENLLENYTRLAWIVYSRCERIPVLKKEYYCNVSKGLWDLTETFFTELGVKQGIASEFGKIVATLFEYDDNHKLKVLDPMSEFTKEEVLNDPIGFLDRYAKILEIRNITTEVDKDLNVINKIRMNGRAIVLAKYAKVLRYIFYIPRFRKAFKKAIEKVEFRFLQLDKYEIFWNLNRCDYDVEGIPFELRIQNYIEQLNNSHGV